MHYQIDQDGVEKEEEQDVRACLMVGNVNGEVDPLCCQIEGKIILFYVDSKDQLIELRHEVNNDQQFRTRCLEMEFNGKKGFILINSGGSYFLFWQSEGVFYYRRITETVKEREYDTQMIKVLWKASKVHRYSTCSSVNGQLHLLYVT